MLAFVDLDGRVPATHPLRVIKQFAEAALVELSPCVRPDVRGGRPTSTPPERLLKASLLIALYAVRSERAFCEELDFPARLRDELDCDQTRVYRDAVCSEAWRPNPVVNCVDRLVVEPLHLLEWTIPQVALVAPGSCLRIDDLTCTRSRVCFVRSASWNAGSRRTSSYRLAALRGGASASRLRCSR
jgi:Transposase domain (DUF772)